MPQLSRRELRNSLVLIMGLASTSLVASVWFCETEGLGYKAPTSGSEIALQSATQIASTGPGPRGRSWEPVLAGIEFSSSAEPTNKFEWVHPEDEVKTERGKLLQGFEASF
ncbi:MAG: hypothetical protein J0L82_00130 [Deltaproteobacteria bacterium]|jgi:hypothetical protein|nr:hypothetical protein [Deltaproteobacteria bacterium]